MAVAFELSERVLARLRFEAEQRRVSVDALIEEMVRALPHDADTPTITPPMPIPTGALPHGADPPKRRRLGFVAIGSSDSRRCAVEADEMLADGFGTAASV